MKIAQALFLEDKGSVAAGLCIVVAMAAAFPGIATVARADFLEGDPYSCGHDIEEDPGATCAFECRAGDMVKIEVNAHDQDEGSPATAYGSADCGSAHPNCNAPKSCSDSESTEAAGTGTCTGGTDEFWEDGYYFSCKSSVTATEDPYAKDPPKWCPLGDGTEPCMQPPPFCDWSPALCPTLDVPGPEVVDDVVSSVDTSELGQLTSGLLPEDEILPGQVDSTLRDLCNSVTITAPPLNGVSMGCENTRAAGLALPPGVDPLSGLQLGVTSHVAVWSFAGVPHAWACIYGVGCHEVPVTCTFGIFEGMGRSCTVGRSG